MADKRLRMRLGAATSRAIDDQILDLIHEKLMASEESAKIPVTGKFIFSIDAEGLLSVDISFTGAIPISRKSIKLKSRGGQLCLWDPSKNSESEERTDNPSTSHHPKANSKQRTKTPESDPERAVSKKRRASPRRRPPISAEARVAEILKSNTEMYRSGLIDRESASDVGVDVDGVDGVSQGTDDMTVGIDGLSEEELSEIDGLLA